MERTNERTTLWSGAAFFKIRQIVPPERANGPSTVTIGIIEDGTIFAFDVPSSRAHRVLEEEISIGKKKNKQKKETQHASHEGTPVPFFES